MVIYNELFHHVDFFCANCVIMVVICAFLGIKRFLALPIDWYQDYKYIYIYFT